MISQSSSKLAMNTPCDAPIPSFLAGPHPPLTSRLITLTPFRLETGASDASSTTITSYGR